MTDTDTYDASRLPRHGQAAIAKLRAEIARLNRDNEDLRRRLGAGADESDTFADPYSDTPQPLGMGTRVRFNGASTLDDTFDVQMQDGELRILINGTTGEAALIPQSNNTIRIRRLPRQARRPS